MMRAGQDYGVRVLHAYSNMTVGRVIFPPAMVRQQLLKAGLVETVEPEAEQAEVPRRNARSGPK